MELFCNPCRWMQGHHPVLQCGEETEAVLPGYVQAEMLWVLFTGSGLHLVAASTYNTTLFCIKQMDYKVHETNDGANTEKTSSMSGRFEKNCTYLKWTSFSPNYVPSWEEPELSLKRLEGRRGFIFWFGPNLLIWRRVFTMWIKWSFCFGLSGLVYSDIRSLHIPFLAARPNL